MDLEGMTEPSLHAAEERARAAEWRVAAIRAIVIGFNIAVWAGALRDGPGIPWLAVTVSVVAGAYAVLVLVGRPDRVWPATATATFTVVTDSVLIALWLVATGGADSPFWPLWFVSLLAIAFRATMPIAFTAGLVYAFLDGLILYLGGAFDTVTVAPVVRVVYIVLMGSLAALVAAEGSRQMSAQLRYRRQAAEAAGARTELDLLQRITAGLADADDLDEALQAILEAAGPVSRWQAGEAWVPRDGRLRCSRAWYAGGEGLEALRQAAKGMSFGPGQGVPGRAWSAHRSISVPDIMQDPDVVRRREAAAAGLHAALAIPVTAGEEIVAVLTFFTRSFGSQDERLMSLLRGATAQLGPELRRKEAEARFRVFGQAAFEGLCIHEGGQLLEANPAFVRLFGLDDDVVRHVRLQDLVDPADAEGLARHIAGGGRAELRFRRASGAAFDAEVRTERLPYRGAVVRVSAVQDITERKRMAEADKLALARQMEITRLQEVDRIRTQLLNVASHELNTPLTPLRLQLHLLSDGRLGPLNAAQDRAVWVLDRNVQRLSALVRDILDVARLQGGRLPMRRSRSELCAIVREAAQTFTEAAAEAGVDLRIEAEANVPVLADPDRLGQVVVNLLSNALKYAGRDGKVRVTCHASGEGGKLVVEDDGIGLDPHQVMRLFKPFEQVHAEGQQQEGTGLGLYISKGIVERHGGWLKAESDGPGLGTRFTAWVPSEGLPDA